MDANWADDASDRRSISSYCALIGDLTSLKSKKQIVVSRSSMKAENHAMAHTTYELLWLNTCSKYQSFGRYNELDSNLVYDRTLWRNLIHVADPT